MEAIPLRQKYEYVCRFFAYVYGFSPREDVEFVRGAITWEMQWSSDAFLVFSKARNRGYEILACPQQTLQHIARQFKKCWSEIASLDFCLTNSFCVIPLHPHPRDFEWISLWDLSQLLVGMFHCDTLRYFPCSTHFLFFVGRCTFRVVLTGQQVSFSCTSCGTLGTTSILKRKKNRVAPGITTALLLTQFFNGHLCGLKKQHISPSSS